MDVRQLRNRPESGLTQFKQQLKSLWIVSLTFISLQTLAFIPSMKVEMTRSCPAGTGCCAPRECLCSPGNCESTSEETSYWPSLYERIVILYNACVDVIVNTAKNLWFGDNLHTE